MPYRSVVSFIGQQNSVPLPTTAFKPIKENAIFCYLIFTRQVFAIVGLSNLSLRLLLPVIGLRRLTAHFQIIARYPCGHFCMSISCNIICFCNDLELVKGDYLNSAVDLKMLGNKFHTFPCD